MFDCSWPHSSCSRSAELIYRVGESDGAVSARGEVKQFVQVPSEKVEAATRPLSPGPKMKNISSVEQFNQFRVNWAIDMMGHESDYEG